ncbi:MAG: alpha-galactosidase [Bradymonadales bacterium]|nr:alpha-galactosidase [Bradymonadales bacterium]
MQWQLERVPEGTVLRHAGTGISFVWSLCRISFSPDTEKAPITCSLVEMGEGDQATAGHDDESLPNSHGFTVACQQVGIRARLDIGCNDLVTLAGRLVNDTDGPLTLHSLDIRLEEIDFGGSDAEGFAFFKNGYQSWTATRSFGARDKERSPWLPPARLMQDNLHNLPVARRGRFTSEMFTLVGDNRLGRYLLAGQGEPFQQFAYFRTSVRPDDRHYPMQMILDFGGQVLPARSTIEIDRIVLAADNHPNRLLERYLDLIQVAQPRGGDLPVGWCTWYYYYTRVQRSDLQENLACVQQHAVDWHYFQLDDGYQAAIGDWLSVNQKFPEGLDPIVSDIRKTGLNAGIWLAPFLASRRSTLFREHPEWFLKDRDGAPLGAGLNPAWRREERIYALDATHPEFQEYLDRVIRTLVHDWGFRFLKLDFLYAACQYGRAHDPAVSPAGRLRLGYSIIRQAAGEEVFLLGCGAPLTPSIGMVDGMRIGPDVASFWFPTFRYHLTRDPHALSARFALRNMLNRSQFHRKLWLNDPDCLLIRDTETRLSAAQRQTLANGIIITGGLLLISDRLSRWSPELWQKVETIETHSRACFSGRTWPLDLMERETAELVYNTTGYLAIFNFSRRARHKRVPFSPYFEGLVDPGATFVSVWDGRRYRFNGSYLDAGVIETHGSLLLKRE